MNEFFYEHKNQRIDLTLMDDIVVVRHKNLLDRSAKKFFSNRITSMIINDILVSPSPTLDTERISPNVTVQCISRKQISIITIPRRLGGEDVDIEKVIEKIKDEEEVKFVSKVFRENVSGFLMMLTDEIVIRFNDEVSDSDVQTVFSEHNLEMIEKDEFIHNKFIVRVKDANDANTLITSNNISKLDSVKYAEPNFLTEIDKDRPPSGETILENQWHLQIVDAIGAWKINEGGSSEITVAIIDDGVDTSHPALRNNIWQNPDLSSTDKNGYNFYDNVPDPNPVYFMLPFDDQSWNDIHGTACAGLACGFDKDRNEIIGIAYRCKILGVKIFGDSPPLADSREIAKAMSYAGKRADIISCSFAMAPNNQVTEVIEEIVQHGRNGLGCVFLVATGNRGGTAANPRPISYPASLPDSISVGASTNSDTRASYSQFGPEIDFLAPGGGGGGLTLYTTDVSLQGRGFNPGKPEDADGLFTDGFSGTSAATPISAGIVALLLSHKSTLKSNEVRDILRKSCDKIDASNANYDLNGFSLTHGYGRINARRALELSG